ncbi:50S ribosomal protein L13 [Candidatus Parcubacteria bacterium]|nr:MAG: 50S ribosomal protein L13 [Candidatus Parcubacteria bacterium]
MKTREIYKIDATGRTLGRLATEIAEHLIGKHRPDFQKHVDNGDIVEVVNVDKIKVSGKKIEQKNYYNHSGFPGGIKTVPMKVLMEKDPAEVLRKAVSRMLPKNKHRTERLKRLKIS